MISKNSMMNSLFLMMRKRAGDDEEGGHVAASQSMTGRGKGCQRRRITLYAKRKLSRAQRRAALGQPVQPILDRELHFFEPLNLRKIGPAAR
jgi:hypothetical protein